jgi:cation:H+ antiporter
VACLPIFFNGRMIARWEGALFLGYYLIYTLYLVLSVMHAPNLRIFSAAMLLFVVPLTLLTLAVVTARNLRRSCQASAEPTP